MLCLASGLGLGLEIGLAKEFRLRLRVIGIRVWELGFGHVWGCRDIQNMLLQSKGTTKGLA